MFQQVDNFQKQSQQLTLLLEESGKQQTLLTRILCDKALIGSLMALDNVALRTDKERIMQAQADAKAKAEAAATAAAAAAAARKAADDAANAASEEDKEESVLSKEEQEAALLARCRESQV